MDHPVRINHSRHPTTMLLVPRSNNTYIFLSSPRITMSDQANVAPLIVAVSRSGDRQRHTSDPDQSLFTTLRVVWEEPQDIVNRNLEAPIDPGEKTQTNLTCETFR